MDAPVKSGYEPASGFVEDKKDPLIDLELTDSTELWLIQWPINQPADFDGQQVSLKLDGDGHLGSFEGTSGKSYDVVSLKSQGPEATVFLSSRTEAKIAGKISKCISLIHYPEPSELQKRPKFVSSASQRSSAATSTMSGRRPRTPSSGNSTTPSSRTKSIGSSGQPSRPSKRKRVEEQSTSINHSAEVSERGNSAVTSTESMEHSEERKSKKIKKNDS